MEKTCSKCGYVGPPGDFKKECSMCKICVMDRGVLYRAKNKEKIAAYRTRNKEKIAADGVLYRAKNKEKIAAYGAQYWVNSKEKIIAHKTENKINLTDAYIKKLLTDNIVLKAADIPPELIALKRADVRLKRLIKEYKK